MTYSECTKSNRSIDNNGQWNGKRNEEREKMNSIGPHIEADTMCTVQYDRMPDIYSYFTVWCRAHMQLSDAYEHRHTYKPTNTV